MRLNIRNRLCRFWINSRRFRGDALPCQPALPDSVGCIAAAIMTPAGRTPYVAELVPPWCRPDVLSDADPFMKHGPDQVEGAQLLYDAIMDVLVISFSLECAEHPIPDDESSGVIAVKVQRVCGVMHAVVTGRVHHRFEPARHPANRFGVDPELIDQIYRAHEQAHHRMKTEHYNGNSEDEAECEEAGPALP